MQNGIDELKNKNIKAIAQSLDGTLWLGSEEGLFFLENFEKENAAFSSLPKLEKLNVWSISTGNSRDLWIGTYGRG